jgi:cytochrome P450
MSSSGSQTEATMPLPVEERFGPRLWFRLWRDPLGTLLSVAGEREFLCVRMGRRRVFLLNDPDDVQHVLQHNHRNYRKSRHYNRLRLLLGNGLVTSEGDLWIRQRKRIQPAFSAESMKRYGAIMLREASELVSRWQHVSRVDVHRELLRVTLHIAARSFFGADIEAHAARFGRALVVALQDADTRGGTLPRLPLWLPTPHNLRFRTARQALDDVIADIVARRRKGAPDRDDLLQLLLSYVDADAEGGAEMRLVRDEALTMLAAGHETTANAVTWTLALLARHPEVEHRVLAELSRALGDGPPSLEVVPKLVYLEQVLLESMPIYPPVWAIDREAIGSDRVRGATIERGDVVMVVPYVLHRCPGLWPSPESFDPERFAPDGRERRHRYAHLPFGAGPRACIGRSFALLEAKILIASVVQRFHLELDARAQLVAEPQVTLRPRGGLPALIHRR